MGKLKRRILLMLLCIFLFVMVVFCYLYLNADYIQNIRKRKICATVLKQEDNLLKIAEKYANSPKEIIYRKSQDESYFIYYKKQNDKTLNKLFQKFRLCYIDTLDNDIVHFYIRPTISHLWDNYEYGFYYTKEDKAVDIFLGNDYEGEEVNTVIPMGEYWYRTEQIDEHWWFYECKMKFFPTKR